MVHVIGVTCGLAACVALAIVASPGADPAVRRQPRGLRRRAARHAGLLGAVQHRRSWSAQGALAPARSRRDLRDDRRHLHAVCGHRDRRRLGHGSAGLRLDGGRGRGGAQAAPPGAARDAVDRRVPPARVDHPRRDRSPDRRGLAASLRPARCRRHPLQPRRPVSTAGIDCPTAGRSGTGSCSRPPHANTLPFWTWWPTTGDRGRNTSRCLSRSSDLFEAPAVAVQGRGCRPPNSCQRWTITSQYLGSSSTSRAWRPAFSQAIRVEPEPPNGSSTMSRLLLELRIARSTRATGFMVGCRSFLTGLSKNQTSP